MNRLGFRKIACIIAVFCAATVVASPAQTFTRLTEFDATDGAHPLYGALLQGTDGNFYGTTSFGGASLGGSVFNITPTGKVTTLYSFCPGAGCLDGAVPYESPMQTVNGNFYGTTYEGGAANDGTIFQLTPNGVLTTLHSFCSEANCADGVLPFGGLIQAQNGNLYGVTTQGSNVYGTVFEMTPAGKLTTLYTFCSQLNCSDGGNANSLMLASNGNFYGTTGNGGADKAGTVFQMTPSGKLTTLYSFHKNDGESPRGLIQAVDGNFYGTTSYGGTFNYGVVFELTPAGQFTLLHSFCSQTNCPDGATPYAPLVQGTDGNFYGTTTFGGVATFHNKLFVGYGTAFQITPTGGFTTLYTFCSLGGSCPDGALPNAGLTQGTDGNFYGTTTGLTQCPSACGTVFRISMGLAPFVEASPNFGRAGRTVNILGNHLTGSTSVTFNGTPATFKVASATLIKVTVPAGATSGTIQVTLPSGLLNSNVAFQVEP